MLGRNKLKMKLQWLTSIQWYAEQKLVRNQLEGIKEISSYLPYAYWKILAY